MGYSDTLFQKTQKKADLAVGFFRVSLWKRKILRLYKILFRFVADLFPKSYQHPSVAFSNFFIIEKMNTAESRQSTTSTPHTIQSGIPVPQMRAMTLVR